MKGPDSEETIPDSEESRSVSREIFHLDFVSFL